MQESVDAMTGWFEWVRWKHHQLVRAQERDLAITFFEEVLRVLRCPIAGLEVAGKKAAEPATTSLMSHNASHPIQEWLAAGDPHRETLKEMAALRERWGDKAALPKEPKQ